MKERNHPNIKLKKVYTDEKLLEIITIANVAGFMEAKEKIYVDSDEVLLNAAKDIAAAYSILSRQSMEDSGETSMPDFCDYVSDHLAKRFPAEEDREKAAFNEFVEAAEKLEWRVTTQRIGEGPGPHEAADLEVEFEGYSPAGEDFSFNVRGSTTEELINATCEMARGFDVEEHAAEWYGNRDKVSGVPQSLKDLLEDAEEIQKMLNELSDAVSAVKQ